MNTKIIIAAATLLLSAGASFANVTDGALPEPSFTSTLTRAQVQQQLAAAQARGEIATGDRYETQQVAAGSRTRNEVRAEAIAYVRMHQANLGNNYYLGS